MDEAEERKLADERRRLHRGLEQLVWVVEDERSQQEPEPPPLSEPARRPRELRRDALGRVPDLLTESPSGTPAPSPPTTPYSSPHSSPQKKGPVSRRQQLATQEPASPFVPPASPASPAPSLPPSQEPASPFVSTASTFVPPDSPTPSLPPALMPVQPPTPASEPAQSFAPPPSPDVFGGLPSILSLPSLPSTPATNTVPYETVPFSPVHRFQAGAEEEDEEGAPSPEQKASPKRKKDRRSTDKNLDNRWQSLVPLLRVWPRTFVSGFYEYAPLDTVPEDGNPNWERTHAQYLDRLIQFFHGELLRLQTAPTQHSIFFMLRFWRLARLGLNSQFHTNPSHGVLPIELPDASRQLLLAMLCQPGTRQALPAADLVLLRCDHLMTRLNVLLGTASQTSHASAWLNMRYLFALGLYRFARPGLLPAISHMRDKKDVKKWLSVAIQNILLDHLPPGFNNNRRMRTRMPDMEALRKKTGQPSTHLPTQIPQDEVPEDGRPLGYEDWLSERIAPRAHVLCYLLLTGFQRMEEALFNGIPVGTAHYPRVGYPGAFTKQQVSLNFDDLTHHTAPNPGLRGYREVDDAIARERQDRRNRGIAVEGEEDAESPEPLPKERRKGACLLCGSEAMEDAVIIPSMNVHLCGGRCAAQWLSNSL